MRFPFEGHRTMAEVAETEGLRAKAASKGPGTKLSRGEWARLEELTSKERESNP